MTSVLVTRPAGETDPVVAVLEGAGYRVHAVPTVATQPLEFDPPDQTRYDWVVVTSAAGVAALTEFSAGVNWAAVGPGTARALRRAGVERSLVAEESNGLALANALPDVRDKRILLVRASAASADLPERLRERGATVDEVAAYLTVEGPASAAGPLQAALADPHLAAILFASGSAVRGFLALGGSSTWPAITIGPRTTKVARELGFKVIAQAQSQTAEALAAAVVSAIPIEERNRA
jgi:uroporphyrinogen-III synthase